ncbi:DUF4168 domain-containing protein [Salinimicrobium xinjiangense]|uniref:DUF4168 domain-containing protein n=1 Tax=Salinimicrobium xinjiangense TaxID=438596 RepID=UPI00048FA394|nr:DUF4168 domain-containing protein [Salinimicrobium xinjiangense]
MIRSNKLAGMIMFFMMLGSTAVFAQQLPQQQQQQEQTEVSDADLQKFVAAVQQIQVVSQQAQQEMMQVVQEEGMEIPRFNEIHEASMNPEVEVEVTAEEKAKHKEIIVQLEGMQADIQKQMEKLITDQGLSLEKYEQIAMRLQSDPALQQRIQQMIQG